MFNDVIKIIEEKRERALSGKFNCIPLPFVRLRTSFPGIEQGKYIIITANQKIGKSKFVDFLFVYNLINFKLTQNPDFKCKIKYFTLEISKESKQLEFYSHLLYVLDGIVKAPKDLLSINKDNPIDNSIIERLKSDKYQKYIKTYEDMVEYIDYIKNPTGINIFMTNYIKNKGHFIYKDETYLDDMGISHKKIDHFELDDPEEYNIIILDNATNLTNEKNSNKRETIEKMSKYFINLRDTYKYTCVLVQHQSQAQESNDNFKLDRLKPTTDGLGDCKTSARDANMLLGIFNPYKFNKSRYENYDIIKLRNHIRFLEIMEDRDYGANNITCPLFFNGASSWFHELPKSNDMNNLINYYKQADKLDGLIEKPLNIISNFILTKLKIK